jgi:hypothetical protein
MLDGKLDALFKLSIIGSVLLASLSVGYYYVIYLPRRDAQLNFEQKMERARSEDARRAEQARTLAEHERARTEQQALEQRQSAEKAGIKLHYEKCLLSAAADYDVLWAAKCSAYREILLKEHDDCISNRFMTKTICDENHKVPDASASCKLPGAIASAVETSLDRARNCCLQESAAGLN